MENRLKIIVIIHGRGNDQLLYSQRSVGYKGNVNLESDELLFRLITKQYREIPACRLLRR